MAYNLSEPSENIQVNNEPISRSVLCIAYKLIVLPVPGHGFELVIEFEFVEFVVVAAVGVYDLLCEIIQKIRMRKVRKKGQEKNKKKNTRKKRKGKKKQKY